MKGTISLAARRAPEKTPLWRIALVLGLAALTLGVLGAGCKAAAEPVATRSAPPSYPDPESTVLTRIALGSCARENKPQPLWNAVVDWKPDLFLFLGDNIYADTTDLDVFRTKYARLAAKPGFSRLRETCPILATWDDHDYGADDAGEEYPKKAESQRIFLDFFDEPADSPRRRRPGVYDARLFGPPGRRVQILLLDTRYFRSPLTERPDRQDHETRYLPVEDPSATILGPAQWRWLEERLREPADLRIVASSIQVLTEGQRGENWANFPHERKRLFDLIARTGAAGVIFVSGDCHYAEFSRVEDAVAYPLVELTSSSINQGWEDGRKLPNRNRLGEYYSPDNFGTILIDWTPPSPRLWMAIHDASGVVVRQHQVSLSELAPR